MKDIAIYFTTIMLEAIPFLILGSIISAIIEVFVKEETFERIIPENKILASIVGVLLGFFLPVCDCAVIPIAMKLKRKKIPTNVIISFMLSSPIINPVVLFSTFFAFSKGAPTMQILGLQIPELFVYRLVFGILVALIVGIIMEYVFEDDILKTEVVVHKKGCKPEFNCYCEKDHDVKIDENSTIREKIQGVLRISKDEFLDTLTYMMMGALIASTMQVFIPLSEIGILNNKYIGTLLMMIFAYLLSLCSTSDSFVARTFLNQMPNTSILAFLIVGPMIDIKNTIVLSNGFKKKPLIILISAIFLTTYLLAIIAPIS